MEEKDQVDHFSGLLQEICLNMSMTIMYLIKSNSSINLKFSVVDNLQEITTLIFFQYVKVYNIKLQD